MPGTELLRGKAGIVTGAAMGLGAAVLERCAAEGARVVAFDRDRALGEATVDAIRARAGEAIFFHGDVREEADWEACVELCCERFGSLDFLDNNAAIAIEALLHETSVQDWEDVVGVNLRGTFLGCREAVRNMPRGGSIVNTSSIAALAGDPVLPAYSATKAGVIGLTRTIAVAYADRGIRCNAVCPGDMSTPMLERTFARAHDPADARAAMERAYPMGRIADPAEIASLVVYLLAGEASFITGAVISVDGGLTAKCY